MVEILKLSLVNIFNSKFTRVADVWLRCSVEILKMKFDQDWCLSFRKKVTLVS